jgi:hypothetical protein
VRGRCGAAVLIWRVAHVRCIGRGSGRHAADLDNVFLARGDVFKSINKCFGKAQLQTIIYCYTEHQSVPHHFPMVSTSHEAMTPAGRSKPQCRM